MLRLIPAGRSKSGPLHLWALMPLALVACVDTGDEGIYVVTNTAVTGGSCSLSGDPSQPQIGHGTINADSPIAYVMTPLIKSKILPVEGVDNSQKTVQLRGADVTLTLKAVSIENPPGSFTSTNPNTALGEPFSVLFSGALGPAASVNSFVDIIPPQQLRAIGAMAGGGAINAEVLAEVVIKGDLNGDEIKSQPFFYPVTVCNDCVVNIVGACPVTGMIRGGNACNPFQDGIVDCCTETSGAVSCPARAM